MNYFVGITGMLTFEQRFPNVILSICADEKNMCIDRLYVTIACFIEHEFLFSTKDDFRIPKIQDFNYFNRYFIRSLPPSPVLTQNKLFKKNNNCNIY